MAGQVIQDGFGHEAARRIVGTQEQDSDRFTHRLTFPK